MYLKGLFYWNKRSPDGLQRSIEYFNRAVEADPRYALAYAGLADSLQRHVVLQHRSPGRGDAEVESCRGKGAGDRWQSG